jgi:hypothetical protein
VCVCVCVNWPYARCLSNFLTHNRHMAANRVNERSQRTIALVAALQHSVLSHHHVTVPRVLGWDCLPLRICHFAYSRDRLSYLTCKADLLQRYTPLHGTIYKTVVSLVKRIYFSVTHRFTEPFTRLFSRNTACLLKFLQSCKCIWLKMM